MTEQQKLDSLDRALDAMRREAVQVRRAVQEDRYCHASVGRGMECGLVAGHSPAPHFAMKAPLPWLDATVQQDRGWPVRYSTGRPV